MSKPFRIKFKSDADKLVSEISINRKTGDFFYFPKEQDFFDAIPTSRQCFVSVDDIRMYDDLVDHISWHKDGTLHIKYKEIEEKSVITKAETSFDNFNRNTLLPLISHSVRDHNGTPSTIIALLAGLNIIENIESLPSPYSSFVVKGQRNKHIFTITNSESDLPFGYIFINIPIFLPIADNDTHFSFTAPLQEDDLIFAIKRLYDEGKTLVFAPLLADDLTTRTKG